MKKDLKIKKEAEENVRASLEALLVGNGGDVSEVPSGMPLEGKLQHPDSRNMDFYQVKDDIEAEARNILKSVMEFYLDRKIIKKNEYVRYKKSIDEMTMSNIIFSLRTTQHAIIKMLQEIDMGNTHPRVYEVLATLNNQLMVVVKHLASYILTLEEGYKKIKHDVEKEGAGYQEGQDVSEPETISVSDAAAVKTRGTKGLMQAFRDLEVDMGSDGARLTDPNARPDTPDYAREERSSEEEEEEDFDLPDGFEE